MNYVRIAGTLLVAVWVSCCQTSYGELGEFGGVKATQLSQDTYSILARANAHTEPSTVRDFTILKAAETTLEADATHFEIVSADDKTQEIPVYASGIGFGINTPAMQSR